MKTTPEEQFERILKDTRNNPSKRVPLLCQLMAIIEKDRPDLFDIDFVKSLRKGYSRSQFEEATIFFTNWKDNIASGKGDFSTVSKEQFLEMCNDSISFIQRYCLNAAEGRQAT